MTKIPKIKQRHIFIIILVAILLFSIAANIYFLGLSWYRKWQNGVYSSVTNQIIKQMQNELLLNGQLVIMLPNEQGNLEKIILVKQENNEQNNNKKENKNNEQE